ncbi:NAD-dependent epimerase/dehydratase family protein [Curvibacter lanceolatus]|uniref:NAD-dependent epimerase/dehydratase family protein n=1 Tax=Curvibacter lanceolatus TaxID=86182 RepID=UPI00036F5A28|nr:NAD-dependent epimerase/dehydratase family protein [Curvibacter lanceolatus]
MHVLITGADGFVGAALVRRLLQGPPTGAGQGGVVQGGAGQGDIRLTLVDRHFRQGPPGPQHRHYTGSFADPALLQHLSDDPPQQVFHLASMPGALAEREPEAGIQANLLATVQLLEHLAGLTRQGRQGRTSPPRVVLASSVAVYGALGPEPVTEQQLPQPELSYGAHKWMSELLLADFSRRGELDGCSLRLPGIVARPATESGHGSAFMSQIFHALREGRPYECPVSPEASAWWMSLDGCLDNLLHAASLSASAMPASRCWQLPVLCLPVASVIEATAQHLGRPAAALIQHRPDSRIEALFGRQPPLLTPLAEAAGFVHDGSVQGLVARVLAAM